MVGDPNIISILSWNLRPRMTAGMNAISRLRTNRIETGSSLISPIATAQKVRQ